jgi:hypothetical protein
VNELVQRCEALESLEMKAVTVGEKRNMRAARKNVERELRRLAPVSRCTSRRPQAPRLVSRAGTGRAPGSPQRGAGGVPPPDDGDGDGDGDPPTDPDSDAIEALARILGVVMPGDRDNAACIVHRVRSGSPDHETGVMQVALSVWLAGISGITVDVHDVCTILATNHVSSSNFPEVAIALRAEYVADGPAIAGPQHADRLPLTTTVPS